MKLKLKNRELAPYINLIQGSTAKGKCARAVSRFRKLLLEKFEVYAEEEKELLKDYCKLGEDGEVNINEDGVFDFIVEKEVEGKKDLALFRDEEIIVDLTEFSPFLENLIQALEESDQSLGVVGMDVLDDLLTKLEEMRKEEE